MDSEVLFTITRENLDTGLRGYPIGIVTTSTVDPENGLYYRGIPVSDMVNRSPEELIFLLFEGHLPKEEELKDFSEELHKRSTLHPIAREAILKLPREAKPMALQSIALMLAGTYESSGDWKEDALRLIAKMPAITALVINHHAGWGETPQTSKERGFAETFFDLLQLKGKSKQLLEALRLFLILHFDHGGGNLSTFVGKAVASGLEDLFGSMAASLNALAGPRHGRANEDCLDFNQALMKELGDNFNDQTLEKALRERLARGDLVFGFGHAVLRVEDSRAKVLYDFAKEHFPDNPLIKFALSLRQVGPKILKENPKISSPYPNVDAISGSVLSAAGFPFPIYFTSLFGLSRVVGIAIQIYHERVVARGGKGVPIYRPKYIYQK
jgi:citrate synthase